MNSNQKSPLAVFISSLPDLSKAVRHDVVETIRLVDYLVSVGEFPADINEQSEYLYAYYPSVFYFGISLNLWVTASTEQALDIQYLHEALVTLRGIVTNNADDDANFT